MKEVHGDILEGLVPNKKTIILHGCNCFHTMGAGIARYLAVKYPLIRDIDNLTLRGDINKLGSYSAAIINDKLVILNCYTQHRPGAEAQVEYIEKCFQTLTTNMDLTDVEIRLPKIGCGIGGLTWEEVKPIFEQYLGDKNTIVYFL